MPFGVLVASDIIVLVESLLTEMNALLDAKDMFLCLLLGRQMDFALVVLHL